VIILSAGASVKEAMMNTVPMERRLQILNAHVEGNSIRSIERMTGTHRDTIMRLILSVGHHCLNLMDHRMQHIQTKRVQVDEIWTYVGMKQKQA
jgi:hypothetical protein